MARSDVRRRQSGPTANACKHCALSTGELAAGYVTAIAILDELLTVDVSDDPELVDIVWGNGRAPAGTRTPARRPVGSIRPPIVGSRPQ